MTDPALAEISGLVDLGERMLVMNDGGDRVSVIGARRRVPGAWRRGPPTSTPTTPRTWRSAADGTLWLADAGDNTASRATVALIALRARRLRRLHRLSYPDGAHDSEALLLAPDGTPYLVTKEVLGSSGVYRPTAPAVGRGDGADGAGGDGQHDAHRHARGARSDGRGSC